MSFEVGHERDPRWTRKAVKQDTSKNGGIAAQAGNRSLYQAADKIPLTNHGITVVARQACCGTQSQITAEIRHMARK